MAPPPDSPEKDSSDRPYKFPTLPVPSSLYLSNSTAASSVTLVPETRHGSHGHGHTRNDSTTSSTLTIRVNDTDIEKGVQLPGADDDGENENLPYSPRRYNPDSRLTRNHQHQRQSSFASNYSLASQVTLVGEKPLELEKEPKKTSLRPLKLLPLPPTPPTPTPKRVFRRARLCTGLCCFAVLIMFVCGLLLFLVLAVNANMVGWIHSTGIARLGFGSAGRKMASASASVSVPDVSTSSTVPETVSTLSALAADLASQAVPTPSVEP